MEYLDIVDENGNPTGEVIERTEAHRTGVLHRTAHVWIARRKEGKVQILLQKRCMDKDSFPGCYDISSAGHVPAGQDYVDSALRELKEELGVEIAPEELIECGRKRLDMQAVFHGDPFLERQVSLVYLLWLDWEESAFCVQREEIDSVMWIEFSACKKAVVQMSIPNCIDIQELELIEKYFD